MNKTRRRKRLLKPGWDVWVYFQDNYELEKRIQKLARDHGGKFTGSGTELSSGRRDNSFRFFSSSHAKHFDQDVRRLPGVKTKTFAPDLADNPRRQHGVPQAGYAYVYRGKNWRVPDEEWDTEMLAQSDVERPALFIGTRYIDGALVNVWQVGWSGQKPEFVAQLEHMTRLRDNPRRPPKQWFRDCVRGVKQSGSAADPQSVCGALWYKKMSKAQRRATLKREMYKMEENTCPDCAPALMLQNPVGGGTLLLLAAAGAGLVWLLWPKTAAAAPAGAPSPPTVSPPTTLPPPATCPWDLNLLDAWAKTLGYALFYFDSAAPPTWDYLVKNAVGFQQAVLLSKPILIVLGPDQSFWTPSGTVLAPAPAQKDDYCVYAAASQGAIPMSKTV
jgi:hypothetical protein